jgi:hypothetical protein
LRVEAAEATAPGAFLAEAEAAAATMALRDGCGCFERGCRGWPLGARVGLRSGSKIAVVLRARPEGPRRPPRAAPTPLSLLLLLPPPPWAWALRLPRAGVEPVVEAADSWLLCRMRPPPPPPPPPLPSLPLSRPPAPVGAK